MQWTLQLLLWEQGRVSQQHTPTSGTLVLLFHASFMRSLLLSLRMIWLYSCMACQVAASSSSMTPFSAKPSQLSVGLSVLAGQPSSGGQGVI